MTAPDQTPPTERRESRVRGLVLTPGAGASRDHHTLLALEQAVAPMPCLRLDFPSRLAGRRAPDRAPVAVAHIVAAATDFAAANAVDPAALVFGGRSYGGRMCSMAVAEGLPAAGLVLLSYPLHPPGRPERLRVEHFPAITVPTLFVSGNRDPFGSPAEFATFLPAIAATVTTVWLSGGHDPRGSDAAVATTVASWLHQL